MTRSDLNKVFAGCELTNVDAALTELARLGVTSLDQLAHWASNSSYMLTMARETGIGEQSMRQLVGHADLSRLDSLNAKEITLLQAAGIHSLQNLARNEPAKLLNWIKEVNGEKRVMRRIPTLERVTEWISGAKSMSSKEKS